MAVQHAVVAARKLGVTFDPTATSIPDEAIRRLHPNLVRILLVIMILADQRQPFAHSNALLLCKSVPDRSPRVEGLNRRFEQILLVAEHEESTTGSADSDCCAVHAFHETDSLDVVCRRGTSDKGEQNDLVFLPLI